MSEQAFKIRGLIEKSSIKVSTYYLDICDGNAYDAIVLGQIMYWHDLDNEGNQRVRHEYGGHKWIVKTHEEWREELHFKSANTIRDCFDRLVKMKLIFKEVHKSPFHDGQVVSYIRWNFDVLYALLKKVSKPASGTGSSGTTSQVDPEPTPEVDPGTTSQVDPIYTSTTITKTTTNTTPVEDDRTPILRPDTEPDRPTDHRRPRDFPLFHKKFCEVVKLGWNTTNQHATQRHAWELFQDLWTIEDLASVRRYCDDGHFPKDITKFQVKGIIGTAKHHYENKERSAAPKQSQFGDLKGVYDHLYQQEAAR